MEISPLHLQFVLKVKAPEIFCLNGPKKFDNILGRAGFSSLLHDGYCDPQFFLTRTYRFVS